MKSKFLLILFVTLIACSKSNDPAPFNPDDPNTGNGGTDPMEEPFEALDLSLITDINTAGGIFLMELSATSPTINTINLTEIFGLGSQTSRDFKESGDITWFNVYDPSFPFVTYNVVTGTISGQVIPCDLDDEVTKYLTFSGDALLITSDFFDTNTSIQSARIRLSRGATDCDFIDIPNHTISSAMTVGDYIIACLQEFPNQYNQKLVKIHQTTGIIEGEIVFIGLSQFTTDGTKLYHFSNGVFKKYDLETFTLEASNEITYNINETFGPFETDFLGNELYLETGFPQPNLFNTGVTVLNRTTGAVIRNAADSDFIPNMQTNLFAMFPNVSNFQPQSIAMDLTTKDIILSVYDGDTGRSFVVYTNYEGELLEVIETPYPASKIIIRD